MAGIARRPPRPPAPPWIAHAKRRLGERLQAFRLAKRLTQAKLSEDADISVDQLLKMEGGRVGGSTETWLKLARALRVPLATLFDVEAAAPTATKAAELAPYKERLSGPPRATEAQLRNLADLISDLDRDAVEALTVIARRLRRW